MLLSGVTFTVIDWNENTLDLLVRILLSVICGFSIGYERKSRSKEAGIRTHSIVCMAAALMMIVSKFGFPEVNADKARLAAQIISGIGFLGAGIIFVRRDILHGLTTAAGIWTTAGIGMAIGAGMYVIGIFSTVLLIAVQVTMHRPIRLFRENTHALLRVSAKMEGPETIDKIKSIFGVKKFLQFKTTQTENGYQVDVELATMQQMNAKDLMEIIASNPFIKSIEKNEEL